MKSRPSPIEGIPSPFSTWISGGGSGGGAGALTPLDTEDGGIFLADLGFEPDHNTSFVREYEVEGEGVWRTMERPSSGADPLTLRIAGYRSADGHDMTGSGRVRFRDTVDGVEGAPTSYRSYTVTTTALSSVTTFDPWGDARTTATFSAAQDAFVDPHDPSVLHVVLDGGTATINSTSPSATTTAGGRAIHHSGLNVPANQNPFIAKDTIPYVTTNQASFPLVCSPGDVFIFSRGDATVLDASGNSPVLNLSAIYFHDKRPPAGMVNCEPYGGARNHPRWRVMLHKSMAVQSRLPLLDITPNAGQITTYREEITRFAPAFLQGTTNTRALFPSQQIDPYHEWTVRGISHAATIMLASGASAAVRDEFFYAYMTRARYELGHVRATNHNYWWEARPLLAGVAFGIPEWAIARKSDLFTIGYDQSYGPDADFNQLPEDDDQSQRFGNWDAMGSGTPALPQEWPANDDAIVWSELNNGVAVPPLVGLYRIVDFTPSSAAEEPRIPGVQAHPTISGKWVIPVQRAWNGARSWRDPIFYSDPRPLTAGTSEAALGTAAYHNVPVNPGGNYRIEYTDGSNSIQKIGSYVFQHMPQATVSYIFAKKLGMLEYLQTRFIEEASQDYIGQTREWLGARSGWGVYNSDPIWGANEPPILTNSVISRTKFFEIVDDVDANGGTYTSSKAAPDQMPRPMFDLVDKGNAANIGITVRGFPHDGNSAITRWKYTIDGGAETIVSNPYVYRETIAIGPGTGDKEVRVAVGNAEGWGPFSEPKTITVAVAQLTVVASANTAAGQVTSPPAMVLTGLEVGDLVVMVATRTSGGSLGAPAGYTQHPTYWNWHASGSNAPEAVHLATKEITVAGDETITLAAANGSFKWAAWAIAIRGGAALGASDPRFKGTAGSNDRLVWDQITGGGLDTNGLALHIGCSRGGGEIGWDNGATVLTRGSTVLPGNEGVQMGQEECNACVIWRPITSATATPATQTEIRTSGEDANLITLEVTRP